MTFIDQAVNEFRFPEKPAELYEPMQYILSLGGKRLRPVLTLIACELFSGEYKRAKSAALALEFFHNFSLLHDDIMDKAPVRRGQPTVHKKWNENIAILSGDGLLIESYKLLCSYPSPLLELLLKTFNETSQEVCEGQQLDMNFEQQTDVSIENYLEMIRLKTSVLLGCSLKIGALIGGANENATSQLYSFGVNLGIAFQLQDDLLDVYGDAKKFGKQHAGDIVANKKTFLLLSALKKANNDQKKKLNDLLNEQNEQLKIEAVIALYDTLSIREETQEKIDVYYRLAIENLNEILIEEEKKLPLKEIAEFVLERQS